MITEDKSKDKSRSTGGLQNEVPQHQNIADHKNENKKVGKPVNNGGVATAKYDLHIEKQWLAVKDEYLANFPETENLDANGEQDSFEALIAKIAKRRQKSTEDIHAEIMNWPTKK